MAEARPARWRSLNAIMATVTTVMAGLVGLLVTLASVLDTPPDLQQVLEQPRLIERQSARTHVELQTLRQEVRLLKQAQRNLVASLEGTTPESRLLRARLQQVEQRQQRLEQVILNDPARALEIPLLRRDIDALREANSQSVEALRRSVEQTYDLSKWLLGALALGVLSLAANSFLSRRDKG